MAHCEAQQSEMGVYSKGASVHVHSTVQCIAGCDASTQQIANASEFSNVAICDGADSNDELTLTMS